MPEAFIRSIFYNKTGQPVRTDIAKLDRATVRKTGGVVLSGTAPEDGFVSVEIFPGTGNKSAPGYVLDVIPGERSLRETPVSVALSPLASPAADIAAVLPTPSTSAPAKRITTPTVRPAGLNHTGVASSIIPPSAITPHSAITPPSAIISLSAAGKKMPVISGPVTSRQTPVTGQPTPLTRQQPQNHRTLQSGATTLASAKPGQPIKRQARVGARL